MVSQALAKKVRIKKEVYTVTFERACYKLSHGDFIGDVYYDPDICMGEPGWRWYIRHKSGDRDKLSIASLYRDDGGICDTAEEALEEVKKTLVDIELQKDLLSRWTPLRSTRSLRGHAYAKTGRWIFTIHVEGGYMNEKFILSKFAPGADLDRDEPVRVYKTRFKSIVTATKSANL